MARRATRPAPPHPPGCPAERVETYEAVRPDGTPVTVTRCCDCGGSVVRG